MFVMVLGQRTGRARGVERLGCTDPNATVINSILWTNDALKASFKDKTNAQITQIIKAYWETKGHSNNSMQATPNGAPDG